MYYADKTASLRELFGTDAVQVEQKRITVNGTPYPIINEVIILTRNQGYNEKATPDIQYTFGREWEQYHAILPEHHAEFETYFDLIPRAELKNARVCDLGCGNGRWSYFLKNWCRELVLIDFSDAIFVARKNLAGNHNCLFFKGDLQCLPFANNCCDFLFSLGVLHHLPTPCLREISNIKKYAPHLLIYLYYNLDNRPWYFRSALTLITGIRLTVSRIRNKTFRKVFSMTTACLLYMPLIALGHVLNIIQLGKYIPLYEAYKHASMKRMEQDVYDRFFTRIEQRVSRKDIMELQKEFSEVRISPRAPYYHFVCKR